MEASHIFVKLPSCNRILWSVRRRYHRSRSQLLLAMLAGRHVDEEEGYHLGHLVAAGHWGRPLHVQVQAPLLPWGGVSLRILVVRDAFGFFYNFVLKFPSFHPQ